MLCEGTGTAAEGTWNRDGVILFTSAGEPLRRVSTSGGVCDAVTKLEGGSNHLFPEFLPDGKHFVFVVLGGDEASQGLYVSSLDDPAPRRLLAGVSGAVFAPSPAGKEYGYLLFLRGAALMAQPFRTETLQLASDAIPVAAEATYDLNGQVEASASAAGLLVYGSNPGSNRYQLTWLDRSGQEHGRVGSIQKQRHAGLSPDGKTAVTVRAGIWLFDLQRGAETRFTSPPLSGAPVWSPEGNWIAFGAGKDLYLKDASGALKEKLLLENENLKYPSDWSRDGRYLIYTETDPKGRGDVWFLPDPLSKSVERKPIKFQGTEAAESLRPNLSGRPLARLRFERIRSK